MKRILALGLSLFLLIPSLCFAQWNPPGGWDSWRSALSSPGPIGDKTPNTGAFTTLTAPQIYGSSADNGDITIEGTSSATKTTSYVILQPTSGNVGIGTTDPGVKLDVIGTIKSWTPAGGDFGQVTANPAGTARVGQYVTNAGSGELYIYKADNTLKVFVTTDGDSYFDGGNVGIGTATPAAKLDIVGTLNVNGGATTGGYLKTMAEATGTPAGTTTYFDITLNIASGAKLQGCQLRVDTALTAGETWSAAFNGGSTTALAAAGRAVAKDTKVNTMIVPEIASNTTNVRVTRDAGNFTDGAGVIRAICYYDTFTAMANAP